MSATRPIPFPTQRRKLKYKLAAMSFIHDGKTLTEAADLHGITVQNLHVVAKEDDWHGFQASVLSGEVGPPPSPGLLAKLEGFVEQGQWDKEMASAMATVAPLQEKRDAMLELLEDCSVEAAPAIIEVLTQIRKEIEDVLMIKQVKSIIPKLMLTPQGSKKPGARQVIDLS